MGFSALLVALVLAVLLLDPAKHTIHALSAYWFEGP